MTWRSGVMNICNFFLTSLTIFGWPQADIIELSLCALWRDELRHDRFPTITIRFSNDLQSLFDQSAVIKSHPYTDLKFRIYDPDEAGSIRWRFQNRGRAAL
jgi:hypothetical protein